jgi:hypothetical protein
MFTTSKIHKLLSRNSYTKSLYKATYPIDRLPQFGLVHNQKPAIIIVNLSGAQSSGSHWILVFLPQTGPAYIFDSFGRDIVHKDLDTFLSRNNKYGHIRNKYQVQDVQSDTCGKYVVAVAYLLARGVLPEQIPLFFSRDTHVNEKRVEEVIKHAFT